MSTPEKLNLWDRLFNRYRKEIHRRGTSPWQSWVEGMNSPMVGVRSWIEYKVIDRLTGSETIERNYLS